MTYQSTLNKNIEIEQPQILTPIRVYGSPHDCGDGSVSIHWFLTEEDAQYDQDHLSQGWGEDCSFRVDTYIDSEQYVDAMTNSARQVKDGNYN